MTNVFSMNKKYCRQPPLRRKVKLRKVCRGAPDMNESMIATQILAAEQYYKFGKNDKLLKFSFFLAKCNTCHHLHEIKHRFSEKWVS